MNDVTFNEFCELHCDGMYDPRIPEEDQCTGYKELKKMVKEGISPATAEEMERWETKPTQEELWSTPDIKYLRFLHPLVRHFVSSNWLFIKDLKLEE